jgi:hypothetical protein
MLDGLLLSAPFVIVFLVFLFAFTGCTVFTVAFDRDFAPAATGLRAFVFLSPSSGPAVVPSPVANRGDPPEIRDGKFVLDDFDPVEVGPGSFLVTCEVFELVTGVDVPATGVPPLIASRTPCRLDVRGPEDILVRFDNRPAERFFDGCLEP